MMKQDDLLIELHTEELPPKTLLVLVKAFANEMAQGLKKQNLSFNDVKFFATPRRLAIMVHGLGNVQPNQTVERRGPALNAAFDKEGKPTKACIGFAQSCGVTPEALQTIKNQQGEWVGYQQNVPGKTITELLPAILEQTLKALPIAKRMRWGSGDASFVRPVHAVMVLYGDQIIETTVLGHPSGRSTRGHRFLAPEWMTIPAASAYEGLLKSEGYVIADFEKRREMISELAHQCVAKKTDKKGKVAIAPDLLTEVTGLVEMPFALCGSFDAAFLALPKEVLISSMQDHQRYFPVIDDNEALMPYFVVISNIEGLQKGGERLLRGFERVLRARLADAQFFYQIDQKEKLPDRLERLRGMVFQAKLGTLYDRSERLSKLAGFIAQKISADVSDAERAGWLAKTDLTTQMVGEFPELQGVMGYYYGLLDKEPEAVCIALKEQYLPRFSEDSLPTHPVGQALALADRIDLLVGSFGINQIPTGDKDPYGLRRAALGILRILLEFKINLDLKDVLTFALKTYNVSLENKETVPALLAFMQERLRYWYHEQGISPDVFAAVHALGINNPVNISARIEAVQAFKQLSAAESLAIANKRVSNILSKYSETLAATSINPALFENESEKVLAAQLDEKSHAAKQLSESGSYREALLQLAELRQPIDAFFDQVMVMDEDKSRRENRILLLKKLRMLFLLVADIALLQHQTKS